MFRRRDFVHAELGVLIEWILRRIRSTKVQKPAGRRQGSRYPSFLRDFSVFAIFRPVFSSETWDFSQKLGFWPKTGITEALVDGFSKCIYSIGTYQEIRFGGMLFCEVYFVWERKGDKKRPFFIPRSNMVKIHIPP